MLNICRQTLRTQSKFFKIIITACYPCAQCHAHISLDIRAASITGNDNMKAIIIHLWVGVTCTSLETSPIKNIKLNTNNREIIRCFPEGLIVENSYLIDGTTMLVRSITLPLDRCVLYIVVLVSLKVTAMYRTRDESPCTLTRNWTRTRPPGISIGRVGGGIYKLSLFGIVDDVHQ